MKRRKSDGTTVEFDVVVDAMIPLREPPPEPPAKLLDLLTKAERNQLLYWLWADAGATPRVLLAWPGWASAFERRRATANASWVCVEELVQRLRAAAGGSPPSSAA